MGSSKVLGAIFKIFSTIRNHKKKAVLLALILSSYLAWRFRDKIPYQKLIQKVMGKLMEAMEKQAKHQQFVEQNTITLNVVLDEMNKGEYISNLTNKYVQMFEINQLRSQLKSKVKEMTKEHKIEVWKQLVNEVILFVFFSLIIQRQQITAQMIKQTLIAKYSANLASILAVQEKEAQDLLDNIFNIYYGDIIKEENALEFLRQNTSHNITATKQMTFFELQDTFTQVFTQSVFKVHNSKQSKQLNKVETPKKNLKRSQITNKKDKLIRKFFWETSDPTYEKPSLFFKIIGQIKNIGKYILPNMYPETENLTPSTAKFSIMKALFKIDKQEGVAEMIANRAIAKGFRNRAIIIANDDNSDSEEEHKEEIKVQISKEQEERIRQAKSFCELILKELRDILEMQSLQSYFYFGCLFDLRKFLNRLLLVLQKKQELKKQPFASYQPYLDKLILEEFFKQDSDVNNQGFYDVRIKKCFGLVKSIKVQQQQLLQQQQQQKNQQQQLQLTQGERSQINASADSTSEALELSSSGEAAFKNNEEQSAPVDPLEYHINLNVLQEIEQNQILEDSLKELIKRIYFERDQSTVAVEVGKPNKQDANDEQMPGGALGQMFNLLGGGGEGGDSQGTGDIMSLLSRI